MSNPLIELNKLPIDLARAEGRSEGVAETFAALVGSPAYQLPEVPSDADEFAARYVRTYALRQYIAAHIANGWNAGYCAGLKYAKDAFDVAEKAATR